MAKPGEEEETEETEERRVHPRCINASNPYHECVEFCFRRILESQDHSLPSPAGSDKAESEIPASNTHDDNNTVGLQENEANSSEKEEKTIDQAEYAKLTPMQKKLFDLRLKLNSARKANQKAIVAEKNREEAPKDTRGMSKQKWFEEKQKRLKKQLDSNGLDMSKAFMLDTQEVAEAKYKQWEKKPAPFGWDVFNQQSLYNAYKKRAKAIPYTMEDYLHTKESDPDFYRDGSSLQYGKAPELPEENIDRMVNELEEKIRKRKDFSRRRKFHDEKDIDSINDRNEHFNRKIERSFGKYTVEIKNNLERGTALPE